MLHAGDVAHGVDDPLAVIGVGRRDGDVAHAVALGHADQVDRPEIAAGLADRRRHLGERAGHRRDLDPRSSGCTRRRGCA